MNRIYQGRVTKVEKLKPGKNRRVLEDQERLENWPAVLWRHHELFQDAVNYYTLALAAMAEGLGADTAQGGAALAWRNQVRENWRHGSWKALRYEGPRRRLAPFLGADADIADEHAAFDACGRAILGPNGSSPAQRAAALLKLFEEAATIDLNKLCAGRPLFLCTRTDKLGAQ